MTKVYVQFTDASETAVCSVYACPQDPVAHPNQGTIDESDARYQAFVNPASTLAGAQAAQISLLQSAYAAALSVPVGFKNAAGVTSTYPGGNTVAINGQTAMQNLEACIDAGATAWTLGKWLDTNNVAQTFTFADLQGLASAMAAVVQTDWTDLVAKVAEVQAATTVAEVVAITF